ncbi:MAG: hypothetical protein JNK53_08340, partial [Phycisphaerae bacterium]|nr:hypothetical protein [Phycisphaerae bacterium]
MARKTGSLAARAVVLFGTGMALMLTVVVAGAWWVSDRILQDVGSVPQRVDGEGETVPPISVAELTYNDVELLRWVLVLGQLVAFAAAVVFFWIILRRQVLTPIRQIGDVAERVGRGELNARSSLKSGDE